MYNSLHVLRDNYTNGYTVGYLDFISIIGILSGVFVIISKNPIVSVLFLIILFLCLSTYLILIGINFIGLSYILVYLGAVSILFLFILMLINVRISELQNETTNSLPLGVFISIYFYYILYELLPNKLAYGYNNEILYNVLPLNFSNEKIIYVTSKLWDGNLAETSHITSIGSIMYTHYFLWLIITSIILLLSMVGAIIITVRP